MDKQRILDIVGDCVGVSTEDIMGRDRSQHISIPRKCAAYVIKAMVPISYEDLGTWMGLRDHSTVMYYCTDIRKKLPTTPMLQHYMQAIEQRLEAEFEQAELLPDADSGETAQDA